MSKLDLFPHADQLINHIMRWINPIFIHTLNSVQQDHTMLCNIALQMCHIGMFYRILVRQSSLLLWFPI